MLGEDFFITINLKNMKLEIKYLAAYLPYNVNLKSNEGRSPSVMTGIQYPYIECTLEHNIANHFSNFSLILRPLSDLTKEIEVNGERFIPCYYFNIPNSEQDTYCGGIVDVVSDPSSVKYLDYFIVEKLLEWHFDIFGLIEAGLAVDVNAAKF